MRFLKSLFFSLLLGAFVLQGVADASPLKRWIASIVDQNGEPITSGVEFHIYTAGSNTAATIYTTEDTSSSASGEITVDTTTGEANWYDFASVTSYDLHVEYKGQEKTIDGFSATSPRQIEFDSRRIIPFDSGNNIASADEIALPQGLDFVTITGTTTINTITAANHTAGRRVTMLFSSACLIGTSGNISGGSSGSKSIVAGGAVDVVYNGTDWHLIGVDTSS